MRWEATQDEIHEVNLPDNNKKDPETKLEKRDVKKEKQDENMKKGT